MSGGSSLASAYRVALFDLDGVLYLRDRPVAGAASAMAGVRRLGLRVGFLTNNAYKPPAGVAASLRALGIDAEEGEVFTSAGALVRLLGGRGRLEGAKVLVVGGPGLREALAAAGAELLAPADWRAAELVAVGLDPDVRYQELAAASLAVAAGARLVGSNADRSFPTPDGPWPGAGALLALLEAATGARAETAGKPAPALFQAAAEKLGPGPYLMVGDRAETDLAGARRLGWDCALVLTGVTGLADLPDLPLLPDYLLRDVRGLLEPPGPAVQPARLGEAAALLARAGLPGGCGEAALGAVAGGALVGAVAWERAGGLARLLGPVVAEGWRGRLTGARLVAAACLRLREQGVQEVEAEVPAGAAGFLERLGFRQAAAPVAGAARLTRALPPAPAGQVP